MRKSFVALCILFLASCTSTPISKIPSYAESPQNTKLSIAYVPNRQLEIEPCGCSLGPMGGLDREWNWIQSVRSGSQGGFLYLSGGTTFLPVADHFEPKLKDFYRKKADFLLEGMNSLKVQALSPSLDDTTLGLTELRRLEGKADFPFFSTNLYEKKTGKPLFRRYLELSYGGTPVLIVGLSTTKTGYPGGTEFEAREPVAVLHDLFAELPKIPRFVVLVSALSRNEKQAVQDQVPEINLILGGQESDSTSTILQHDGSSLFINPTARGRAGARVDLEGIDKVAGTGVTAFYSPRAAAFYEKKRHIWQAKAEDVDKQLQAQKVGPRDRESLEQDKKLFVDYLRQTASIPLQPSEQTVLFNGEIVYLNSGFEKPENSLTRLLEKFKESVHEAALQDQ